MAFHQAFNACAPGSVPGSVPGRIRTCRSLGCASEALIRQPAELAPSDIG
jgi:hypothetical protein